MRILLSASLVVLALTAALAQGSRAPARLIAIADIHGAYTEFTQVLKRAGLVDDQLKWSGGRSTLVQTGDYTDRGTDVRKVLDLLLQLERDARTAGGEARVLLGNHEVMNVIGDWRDVTPEICAAFVTPKSEERREDGWKQYDRLKQGRADLAAVAVYQLTREQWMDAHPPGCLEYREAMAPSGVYGRWLRQKDIAAEIGGNLFMHAGINPSRPAPRSINEVNERARAEIKRLDSHRQRLVEKKLALPSFTLQQILGASVAELQRASQAFEKAKAENEPMPSLDFAFLKEAQGLIEGVATFSLVDPEGPLWFRGYAQWDEAATAAQVTAFLDQFKLTRVIVGHTPTEDRKIQTRYNGRVILMDTGMLRAVYEGTPAALEISGTAVKAIYPDNEVPLTTGGRGGLLNR